MDPRLRTAMARDWVSDLREFGAVTVAKACADWRQTESKKPAIADIRKLCFAEQQRLKLLSGPRLTYAPRRLPDTLVRENWRDLRTGDWTAAELAIRVAENRAEAKRRGYGDDPDAWQTMVTDELGRSPKTKTKRRDGERPVLPPDDDGEPLGHATEDAI